ncbi:SusC/RagA family TonB-linked outer membrane protein [Capnocytophaga catalasegens]|uniref:SusC/RagA family TonB-linked outer membrane protein n=1 Tax=Capnocytophaga catalasegens TaxID=1004260 RepID=A0AAV5AV93_9FLAO|nr:TonB-dependent receptor [Capnocytophaga catalasegens]GJM49270.1 SusC/RagA family TonB-linked outer membrane protein [Capnocytophaga catalasegens]GJM52421.1 SusC/RagA family TonB-linked outer membrane protein [Capnocytophaga catalasegens]
MGGGKSLIINVILKEDAQQLDDVVVVGYGTQKKVNLTGAVASIDTKKMASRPSTNITKTLQGAVPGVTIISRPGGTSLNIRGRGNLGSSEPLYIVDGIEVSSSFFNALNPNSIESISFLKDASSAAIYGAKAAFGVVLVSTKAAKSGVLQISYDGSTGVQMPTYLPKMVNSAQYAEMYREAERNSGVQESNLTFTDEMIRKYADGSDPDRFPDTNWFDLILRKQSFLTKHNLQFSAGSDKFKYVIGTGFLREEDLTPGVATNRYNINTKTSSDLKPWLTITSNINFIYNKYDRKKGSSSLLEALRVPPTQVAKHSNGNWGSVRNGRQATGEEISANPLRSLEENGRANSTTKRLLGSIGIELRPLENMKITNQLGYNYFDYRGFSFTNRKKGVPSFLNPASGIIPNTELKVNQMDLDWRYSDKWIYDGWINYDKTFNQVHSLTAMAGAHADIYQYKRITVGRKNFASDEMNDFKGGSIKESDQLVTNRQNEDFYLEENINSYFGRLGYTYDQKYLFEANFRADASSRFAKEGRWGYFPSFSVGWRMEQEEFMRNLTWIDGLKWRASWGKNGNINNIGLYDTYSTYNSSGTIVLGGVSSNILTEGRLGNKNLTWETTITTNVGLDLSISKGLLGLTIDYYDRLTDGILIRANDIMTETGLSSEQIPARNVGKVRNKGVELVVSHANKIGDFSYNLSFNATHNKNIIEDLGDKVTELPPSDHWIFRKGGSIGDFYMLQADGVYSTQDVASGNIIPFGTQVPEAGMVKYVDANADGKIDSQDRIIVANDVPKFTYGFNVDLNYKNFSLSVFGQGVTDVKVYLSEEASQAFFDNSVPRQWQTDYWTENNQNSTYLKLFTPADQRYKYNNQKSSYWLFDASYFRIKNVTLSYSLSDDVLKQIGLTNARIFLSADNIFTIRGDKRMKDFDPEVASGRGYSLGLKSYTAGITFTF